MNGDGECSLLAAYRRAYGRSKCRQPPGAVLVHRMNRVNSRNALSMMTAP